MGTFEVDRYTLETSRAKFYAGGDAISGASNVSNAMGYGNKGRPQHRPPPDGSGPLGKNRRAVQLSNEVPEQPSTSARHKVGELPALERVETFEETTLGLSADEALEEAARCLRCDVHEHH